MRRWHRLLAALPLEFQRVRPVYLAAIIATLGLLIYYSVQLFWAKPSCERQLFQCGAVGGLEAIGLVAFLGLGAFVWLSGQVRRGYLRRARTSPGGLFPSGLRYVSPKEAVESVGEIVDTIAPPLTGRNRLHSALIRISSLWWPVEGSPPQLVVGQAGEGKTTLLVHLTERLAKERYVPVPVSLRGVEKFDSFLDLARQAFRKAVDDQLARSDEGDRIWRWIRRSGRLVILVDDLQLLPTPARGQLYQEFLEAERRNYALVVTSRRDYVGRSLEQWQVPLSRLDPVAARDKVLGYADNNARRGAAVRRGADFDRDLLLKVIQAGELNESRYYLSVLARLLGHGALSTEGVPDDRSALEVRRWLFERYVEAFLAGALDARKDDEANRGARETALAVMRQASYKALVPGADPVVHGSIGMDGAIQAGLLRRRDGGPPQIEHALLQSYLAAGAIENERDWRTLVPDRTTPETRDALLFYAGIESHPAAGAVVRELLTCKCEHDEERISTTITATDVAIAAKVDMQDELAQALRNAWQLAGALDRRVLVERLARLPSDKAIEVLWENCDDPSYQVSWAAGCALAGEPAPPQQMRSKRAERVVAILADRIDATIKDGEGLRQRLSETEGKRHIKPRVDDWHPRVRPLKRLGWILPVLAVGDDNNDLFAGIDRILRVFGLATGEGGDGLTTQRGPEASIAQGFKAAARLAAWELPQTPTAEVGTLSREAVSQLFNHLLTLHDRALFWYARLVLLHGMTDLVIAVERDRSLADALEDQLRAARGTIMMQAERQRCGKAISGVQGRHPPGHEHAFVVEAARLCRTALSEIADLPTGQRSQEDMRKIRDKFIWDDEGVAVSGAVGPLDPHALRLLGDVAVVLNLNEKGPSGEPGDREREKEDFDLREQFGQNDYLPVCLSERRGRRRITTSECGHGCPFKRCPYPDTAQRAHREVSKMFCRHLRKTVLPSLQTPPWQPRLGSLAYSRFWLQMERKAKYGG